MEDAHTLAYYCGHGLLDVLEMTPRERAWAIARLTRQLRAEAAAARR